jgi:hypothetical protein
MDSFSAKQTPPFFEGVVSEQNPSDLNVPGVPEALPGMTEAQRETWIGEGGLVLESD